MENHHKNYIYIYYTERLLNVEKTFLRHFSAVIKKIKSNFIIAKNSTDVQ